jgi:energy-coupling factor transporter ATP-binding protein EcfA2
MGLAVSRFRVANLHGGRTIDVPIEGNKLVLVGENGTGKSTVANLLFYVLTRQWNRLRRYRFASVEISLNGEVFVITPEMLTSHHEYRQKIFAATRHFPINLREFVMHVDTDVEIDQILHEPTFTRYLYEQGLSPAVARDVFRHGLLEAKKSPTPELEGTGKRIAELMTAQVLYLPTYRRIEQDLESIFPGAEIEGEIKKIRERVARRGKSPYTELVAFGMEDVEKTINERLARIKDSVRKELSNLTGTYLRDVLRGVHNQVDWRNLQALDPATLDAIFARMDDATLPKSDQKRLRQKVSDMSGRGEIEADDRVIAHFLSKLLALYREQQASEIDVRNFVSVCNGYLTGKELVYDDVRYELTVKLADKPTPGKLFPEEDEPLRLKWLSSGEKQIVSLFSHIYLTKQTFFVIIDEPELSLSVPWQRKFLPDILGTSQCDGLVAVTHSPFIFDNELEPYVRSIMEFTRVEYA